MTSPLNMRRGGSRSWCRWALGLCLVLASAGASAQLTPVTSQSLFLYQAGNTYGGDYLALDGGVIYTDNVQRIAGGSSQTLLLAGLSGNASHEGTNLDFHLLSNLAVVKYIPGAFPTGPSGYLDGMLKLKIVPGFFSWIVRETYSQVQINPYTPATPENLESLNFFTTGPRLTMRPTLRTTVTLDALYSYLTSSSPSPQFVNIDNHRYGGDLRIDRAFSDIASFYVRGHYEKVEFKDQVNNNDFSLGEAVAGYRLGNGRTVFDLSGGYSQLHLYNVLTVVEGPGSRETFETQKFDEPIWSLAISRLITPSQRLALTAGQQFTDMASAFRLGFDQPVPTVAPPRFATSEPFKQRYIGVNWRFQASRTSIDVAFGDLRERYLQNTGNDRNVKIASAYLDRLLNPVLSWDIGVTYQYQEQVGVPPPTYGGQPVLTGQSSKIYGAITDLRWQVGERLAVRFIYAHSRQTGAYSDNQVGVTASWAVLGAQASVQTWPGLAPIAPASTLAP